MEIRRRLRKYEATVVVTLANAKSRAEVTKDFPIFELDILASKETVTEGFHEVESYFCVNGNGTYWPTGKPELQFITS